MTAASFKWDRESTHFQSEETWEGLMKDQSQNGCKSAGRNVHFRRSPGRCFCMTTPRNMEAGSMEKLCAVANIIPQTIPACETHVFQPADMFVISCLKELMRNSWSRTASRRWRRSRGRAKGSAVQSNSPKTADLPLYRMLCVSWTN